MYYTIQSNGRNVGTDEDCKSAHLRAATIRDGEGWPEVEVIEHGPWEDRGRSGNRRVITSMQRIAKNEKSDRRRK